MRCARRRETFADYERALTECLAQAQRAGDVRVDLPPAVGATLVLAVLRGFEALGRAGHPTASLHASADAALALIGAAA